MAGGRAQGGPQPLLESAGSVPVVAQVAGEALSAESHQDPETELRRRIEHPEGRSRIGAQRVDPRPCHQFEVALDGRERGELSTGLIRAKRPIGYAPYVELLVPEKQELASNVRPQT